MTGKFQALLSLLASTSRSGGLLMKSCTEYFSARSFSTSFVYAAKSPGPRPFSSVRITNSCEPSLGSSLGLLPGLALASFLLLFPSNVLAISLLATIVGASSGRAAELFFPAAASISGGNISAGIAASEIQIAMTTNGFWMTNLLSLSKKPPARAASESLMVGRTRETDRPVPPHRDGGGDHQQTSWHVRLTAPPRWGSGGES